MSRLPAYGAGLLVVAGIKWLGSRAGADELGWILAPTAWLASFLSGVDFERELRAGWVSHEEGMILGPTCSGLNFLIIAFAAFFFGFVSRFRSSRSWKWLGTSLAASFLLTIMANAIRVVAAIHLYRLDLHGSFVTPERVHRLAGVVIYCTSLLLAYLAAARFFEGKRGRASLAPLGWYLAVVVGFPLANRAHVAQPALFLEHTAVVLAVCTLLAALVLCLPRSGARITSWDRPGSR